MDTTIAFHIFYTNNCAGQRWTMISNRKANINERVVKIYTMADKVIEKRFPSEVAKNKMTFLSNNKLNGELYAYL